MKIVLIAAMAKNRVIGKDNQMPWHLPADLKHFKQITSGKTIVMGRLTFESIGRPLPNRRNIVISRQPDLKLNGVEIFHSLDEVFDQCATENEIMIIGGQKLFEQTIAKADQMYLTFIDVGVEGDTFFPAWDEKHWQQVAKQSHPADDKNPYSYQFVTLKRVIKLKFKNHHSSVENNL